MHVTAQESAQVTVVVVTWQAAELLAECLASLGQQTLAHEVIVVDNASTDGTCAMLADRFSHVHVLALRRNTGFAGGVAAALPLIRTEYVAWLNNDAAAEPTWLAQSVAVLRDQPQVTAVAARMTLWSQGSGAGIERINNAGVILVAGGYAADRGLGAADDGRYSEPATVFGFSGGATVLRTDAVRAAGGVPARYFLYYEDVDLAWRLRLRNGEVRYEPSARVRHRHGASSDLGSEMFAFYTERNRLLTLLRCAPLGFALGQVARFTETSVSLAGRRLLGQDIAAHAVFRTALRLRVLGAVIALAPWALAGRRRIGRSATVRRSDVLRGWIGRDAR